MANDGADTKALTLLISLMNYGYANSEVTILEGSLKAKWYRPLFEQAVLTFQAENIFAYYYDLPFEETLKRHATKPNKNDFGEDAMKRWRIEKYYIDIIPEKILTKDLTLEETVELIISDIRGSLPKRSFS